MSMGCKAYDLINEVYVEPEIEEPTDLGDDDE